MIQGLSNCLVELADSATEAIANIRDGTTKDNVGLRKCSKRDTTLATQFTERYQTLLQEVYF